MQTATYHNTNQEQGRRLEQSQIKAGTQQAKIMAHFETYPGRWFTPFDIQASVLTSAPITSVRRAITNLEQGGHLVKSSRARGTGRYGKANHQWSLKQTHGQLALGLFFGQDDTQKGTMEGI